MNFIMLPFKFLLLKNIVNLVKCIYIKPIFTLENEKKNILFLFTWPSQYGSKDVVGDKATH